MDEVSYGAEHKFLTCVVDHQAGSIVWATEGRNAACLQTFFAGLTDEQKAVDQGGLDRHVRRL